MTTIRSFEEFDVWQTAREISRRIYALSRRKPFAYDYGLKDQICRSSVSIMSNIAEGYESLTRKVFIRHLGIAKGSAGEVRAQLFIALDQNYITDLEFRDLAEMCKKVSRQLSALIDYLKNSKPPA
jgi:four helix bundle protein